MFGERRSRGTQAQAELLGSALRGVQAREVDSELACDRDDGFLSG